MTPTNRAKTPMGRNLLHPPPLAPIFDRRAQGRRSRWRQGAHSHQTDRRVLRTTPDANAGQCWPSRTSYVPVGRQDYIAPTASAVGAPKSRIQAQRQSNIHQTGGGEEFKVSMAQRSGGGNMEGRSVVTEGDTENFTESKIGDDIEKGGRDGGWKGGRGGSTWVRSYEGGPADPRGLCRTGSLQHWSTTQWGHLKQQGVADPS